ncbi:hypothetical protein HHK36_011978 [Tetracentron sinense]|uniref:Phytosulfokine n=1 Tax=Tetracentron sinense TaxID=13715 RepID=A0A834ZBX2_TETSI|nr:hypothetical protein HHK36_011978 [Tetracentron sinense]
MIQSSVLEVFVKGKEMITRDDYHGKVMVDMNEVPTKVPPDNPLAVSGTEWLTSNVKDVEEENVEVDECCEGVGEEDCLMRRIDHTDYIYTRSRSHELAFISSLVGVHGIEFLFDL